jgi:hypothetical protein
MANRIGYINFTPLKYNFISKYFHFLTFSIVYGTVKNTTLRKSALISSSGVNLADKPLRTSYGQWHNDLAETFLRGQPDWSCTLERKQRRLQECRNSIT